MKISKAEFAKGVTGDDYGMKDNLPHIAFFGRSNAGKSSVINSLVGEKDYGEIYPTPRVWCSYPVKIVEKGDIFISVRAPVGTLNIAKEKSCIGRGLSGLRSGNKLDQNFLFHFLKLKEKDISNLGTGSTFTAISKKHLENFQIPLPTIGEQRKIVAKIEKLFAKIDEAQKVKCRSCRRIKSIICFNFG